MYKKIENYCYHLTLRNWGAPWHFILVALLTAFYIHIFSPESLETPQMQIFAVVLFSFLIGYEIWQILYRGQTIQGAVEDMAFNVIGFLAALLPLTGAAETGLAAVAAVPFLSKNPRRQDEKFLICIDAGHGGKDPGAWKEGAAEKDSNLIAALELQKMLQVFGINTVMTRTADDTVSLENRVAVANTNYADLFISLHCNSTISRFPHGVQTFWYTERTGQPIARLIQPRIDEVYGKESVWNRAMFANLYVLKHTVAPAVLVEMGFLSNDEDRKRLTDKTYLRTIAAAIADALVELTKPVIAIPTRRKKQSQAAKQPRKAKSGKK